MIVVRAALLLGATASGLIVLGALKRDWQPSLLCLLAASMVAVLAPLFWPGSAHDGRATSTRVLLWSAIGSGIVVLAMTVWGGSRPTPAAALRCIGVLAAILYLSHMLAVFLEYWWTKRDGNTDQARDAAGRAVALSLVLLGSLPLWLGPAAELLSDRHAWAVDAVLGLSPLTHLAVASGNDLLRNQWLYQHSNLSGLQFDYPALGALAWAYGSLCLVAGAMAMAVSRRRGVGKPPTRSHLSEEKTP
jgi:hypothetical protein